MKVVGGTVVQEKLEGDPLPALPPPRSGAVSNDVNADTASAVMKRLMAEGLYKRGVVCHQSDDDSNCVNWGVIIDVHPFRSHPLEIRWLTGHLTASNGSDLKVIYSGMTQIEFRDHMVSQREFLT
jgi:hypothetical protein